MEDMRDAIFRGRLRRATTRKVANRVERNVSDRRESLRVRIENIASSQEPDLSGYAQAFSSFLIVATSLWPGSDSCGFRAFMLYKARCAPQKTIEMIAHQPQKLR